MKTSYTLLVIVITLSSCWQESLDPSDLDFRGSWDSNKYAMQIHKNGYGVLDIKNRGRCEGNVRVDGSRLIFTSETETDAVGYKRFHIDQRPTTDSLGVSYMILDGHRLERH